MRNRALALAARPIPYIKELRDIAGAVTSAILMQQLDHWFNTYPEGFYKFLAPCDSSLCKPGEAWTEELGFSEEEFRTAFDRIGIRYGSKRAYETAPNPFLTETANGPQELYYASYHDRIKGQTYYFRNHNLVDTKIDELMSRKPATETGKVRLRKPTIPPSVSQQPPVTEAGNPNLRSTENPSYGTGKTQATEHGNPDLEYKETKKTSEKTTEKTTKPGESSNELLPLLIERFKGLCRKQKDETDLRFQSELLRGDNWTVEELKAWLAWRRITPAISYVHEKATIWRDDQKREHEKRIAEAYVGASESHRNPTPERSPEAAIEKPPRKGVYSRVIEHLSKSLEDAAILSWFEPLTEDRVENGVLFLRAPNEMGQMFQDYILFNYGAEFDAAIKRVGLIRAVFIGAIEVVEVETEAA